MKRAQDVHVRPEIDIFWHVRQGGRELSHHRTKDQAVEAGRRVAKRKQVDLVTWSAGGSILSKDSYGNETAAPDKEH